MSIRDIEPDPDQPRKQFTDEELAELAQSMKSVGQLQPIIVRATAKPGHLNIFDISKNAGKPELIKSIATAEGAHHVAMTKDEKLGFVQNSLLNLPGMSDGSITVIDLVKGEVIGTQEEQQAQA